MGFVKNLNLKKENNNQWEIQVIRKDEGRPTLSYVKQKALRTDWIFEEHADKEKPSGASNSIFLIDKMRGDCILAKWREEQENLIDEKKIEEAQELKPMDINITCAGDQSTLKLIRFVPTTQKLPLPTTVSEEEHRR